MCYRCMLNGADSVALVSGHSGPAQLSLRLISTELLISPEFRNFSTQQVVRDGVMDVYLHRPAGPTVVNGGVYGSQTIQALELDDAFYSFLQRSLAELDAVLALDFRLVNQPEAADLAFYLDSEINLAESDGGITLGIALSNSTSQRSFWELMLNTPAFNTDTNSLHYAALHEFGHGLGLEHPFEDSDGDVAVSSDPWRSAFPEDTVMAYRSPRSGVWPTAYTSNDLAALQAIWGTELQSRPVSSPLPQRLIGTTANDQLIGGLGNDLLRGELGSDTLIGGGGADQLWGGPGSNRFSSAADGARDWILISRDGSRKLRNAAATVDLIEELGPEDRIGILGARSSQLRFKSISLSTSNYGALDGIGIFVKNNLEAIYTGSTLSRSDLRGLSQGMAADFAGSFA